LLIEVVDPEFVEVAEDDAGRAVGDDVGPVIEDLVVVALELLAARFHLDEDPLGPEEVDIVLALGTALFGHASLAGGSGFLHPGMAEGAEEMIEEVGGLALFVASEMGLDVGDKFGKGGGGIGYGGVWRLGRWRSTVGCGENAATSASQQAF